MTVVNLVNESLLHNLSHRVSQGLIRRFEENKLSHNLLTFRCLINGHYRSFIFAKVSTLPSVFHIANEKKNLPCPFIRAFQFIREFTILKLPNQNSTAYCFLSPITSHQATNMLLIKTDGSWSSVSSFRILSEFQS